MWQLIHQEPTVSIFSDGTFRLRLEAYSPHIIRVTHTGREEFFLASAPMITGEGDGTPLVLTRDSDTFALSAGVLSCSLNPRTGALRWMVQGETVMREPENDGRILREIDVIKYRFDPDAPLQEVQTVDGVKVRATGIPYVDRKAYQTRLSFVFDEDEDIFGLGQHEEGILNYRGQHQYLYQNNLKIAAPVILSSKGWAVLNNCCCAQIFHDDAFGSYISADCAEELDYFVIFGPEFDQLVGAIRHLTGDAPMLPRWTLGYVQSKERYCNGKELEEVAAEYRRRNIPLDCIVQDWCTWPDGLWGQKTVDESRYPDLPGTIARLHDMDVKVMWSIWPNMTGEGPNRQEMREKGFLLGNRSTYNAFLPEARNLYWEQCNAQLFPSGVDAWWCDCTEPFEADWYGAVKPFPEDRMFLNVNEFKQYLDPAQILAYSIHHSQGIYEGQRSVTEEKRVVNLTRSGLTGQQRYGTICWNGDTSATWEILRKNIPDGLNLSATGMPYWTVDAGAFFATKWDVWFGFGAYNGCEDVRYRELYLRWLQLSAFLPMMRSHGTSTPREVWRFGNPGEVYYDAIVEAIRLRCRLMPYLYSEMAAVHFDRSTMLRMLAFDFRQDAVARNIPDQFMLGRSLMVCPILQPAENGIAARRIYLPNGCDWYDFHTNIRYPGGQWLDIQAGLSDIPLFVRSGSMIPLGQEAQNSWESAAGGITLNIYTGADAAFPLYNDAGDGYGYEQGEYLRTFYRWNDANETLTQTRKGNESFAYPAVKINLIK